MSGVVDPRPAETARLEAAGRWCLRLAEGGVSPADYAALEVWLSADRANRAAFEDTVGVWAAVDEAGLNAEIIGIRRSALAALERNRRRPARVTLRLAAAVLVVAVLAGVLGFWFVERPQVLETGIGERRVVMLEDSSRVSLDSATAVEVRYHPDRRSLRLVSGRARFDVAKDAQRPFTVSAGDRTVRATGTRFSVELLQQRVRVVLYEGHVVVRSAPRAQHLLGKSGTAARAADARSGVPLAPGQELVASLAGAKTAIAATDLSRTLAWEAGQLVFVDESLASVVERANRYSRRQLRIGDAAAGAVRVDGVFAAGDTDALVEGLTGLLSVRAVDEGDHIALYAGR